MEQLIRAYQAELYRYLRYLGAQPALAEDLMQETFLATLRSNPHQPTSLEDPGWSGWLRGIARNLFLAECRRAARHALPVDDPMLEQAEKHWSASGAGEVDWAEQLAALQACLATLPARQREVLDHRYVRRTAREEMARLFGMSEDGIKSLLRRVRAALARCIEERIGVARGR